MELLLSIVGAAAGIVSLVCFILILIAMFKSGDTVLGIVCIVLCFIGPLIALVTGWMNADKWNVRKIMPIYTAAFVVSTIVRVYLRLSA